MTSLSALHEAGSARLTNAAPHGVVWRDPAAYCAHPHLAVAANGDWLLAFTQAPKRPVVLHPPLDPDFRTMLMRSADEGRSWSAPEPVPDGSWTGVECPGLTPLRDGSVLLNQWRFDWIDARDVGPGQPGRDLVTPAALDRMRLASIEFQGLDPEAAPVEIRDLFPMARRNGGTFVHKAASAAAPFGQTVEIDTAPYSGGYGMRGGIELANGDILLPLSDVPQYRTVFVVRSSDGGASWSAPVLVAAGEGHEFEEPAPLLLPDGRILMLLRDNGTRILHAVWSNDQGASWSAPEPTAILDYPADMILLRDGRIAMVAGRRRAPFGVALYLSDDGSSWSEPWPIRDDLPDIDLGYPTLAQRADGDLLALYYGRDAHGVTGIHSTLVPAAEHEGRAS